MSLITTHNHHQPSSSAYRKTQIIIPWQLAIAIVGRIFRHLQNGWGDALRVDSMAPSILDVPLDLARHDTPQCAACGRHPGPALNFLQPREARHAERGRVPPETRRRGGGRETRGRAGCVASGSRGRVRASSRHGTGARARGVRTGAGNAGWRGRGGESRPCSPTGTGTRPWLVDVPPCVRPGGAGWRAAGRDGAGVLRVVRFRGPDSGGTRRLAL